MPKILTEEEVKQVRRSMITISIGNVMEMIKSGGTKPTIFNNGYMAGLSLDIMNEKVRLLHLSVSKRGGDTDIDIAQKIADDIMGEGNTMIGPMNLKNVIHFTKVEKEDTMTELMKNIDDKRK